MVGASEFEDFPVIAAISGSGVNKARATCDICGREEVTTCNYERVGRDGNWKPDEGQVVRKLTAHGWALVKGKLNCPGCEAKRKAAAAAARIQEEEVAGQKSNIAPIRQPTREQRREIRGLLDEVYDVDAGRYQI